MVLILDDSLEGQEEEEEVRSRHRRATTAKDVHKRMEVGEGKEGSTSTPPVAAAVGFSQEVCAICLEAIREPAAQPNSCSHCFCFDCLFTWSRCAAVCPLCKRHFHSIATRPVRAKRLPPKSKTKRLDCKAGPSLYISLQQVLRPQPAPLERRRPIHIDLEEIVISDNEDEGGGGQFHTANAGADQRQQQQAPAVMIDLTDVGGVSTDEQHGGVAMVEVHVPGSDGEEDEGEQAPIVGSFSGCMIIG